MGLALCPALLCDLEQATQLLWVSFPSEEALCLQAAHVQQGSVPHPSKAPPTVEPPGLPVYSRPLSRLGGDSLGLLCSLLPSSPTSPPPARPSEPLRPRLRGAVQGGHLRPPPQGGLPGSTLSLRLQTQCTLPLLVRMFRHLGMSC